jgi:hypothetical protein
VTQPIAVKYTGIDEIVQALRGVDDKLLYTLNESMREVGDVVRDDARERFVARFSERSSVRSALSVARTADNFQTQSRGITSGTSVRVAVGQRLRKVTGKRPDWGSRMMEFGLVPARDSELEKSAEILEDGVYGLLRTHGF